MILGSKDELVTAIIDKTPRNPREAENFVIWFSTLSWYAVRAGISFKTLFFFFQNIFRTTRHSDQNLELFIELVYWNFNSKKKQEWLLASIIYSDLQVAVEVPLFASSSHPHFQWSPTVVQSKTGFFNLSLTTLCTLQAHCVILPRSVTSGGCFSSTSLKWDAQSPHGYNRANRYMKSLKAVCSSFVGSCGNLPAIVCRSRQADRPSSALRVALLILPIMTLPGVCKPVDGFVDDCVQPKKPGFSSRSFTPVFELRPVISSTNTMPTSDKIMKTIAFLLGFIFFLIFFSSSFMAEWKADSLSLVIRCKYCRVFHHRFKIKEHDSVYETTQRVRQVLDDTQNKRIDSIHDVD